jgi:hypothetical protein
VTPKRRLEVQVTLPLAGAMMFDVAPKLKTIVKQLSAVAGTEELVRVRRTIRKADHLNGFVVGIGERWVLLNVFDPDMFLDGYAALWRGVPWCTRRRRP